MGDTDLAVQPVQRICVIQKSGLQPTETINHGVVAEVTFTQHNDCGFGFFISLESSLEHVAAIDGKKYLAKPPGKDTARFDQCKERPGCEIESFEDTSGIQIDLPNQPVPGVFDEKSVVAQSAIEIADARKH